MGLLGFFAVVGGSLSGTLWGVIAPVEAEVVGLQDLPAALSVTWVLMTPPTTVAEAIALKLRKSSGNIYINAQIFTAMMYIGGSLCLWLVRAWKVGELEVEDALQSPNSVDDKASGRDNAALEHPSTATRKWRSKGLVRRLFTVERV